MFLRRFFGSFISKIIMPAQQLYPAAPHDPANQSYSDSISSHLKLIKSSGNAQIGVRQFCSTTNLKITPDTKVILHAFGNADCVENHQFELQEASYSYKETIVAGMNFRNVGKSQGSVSSEKDWVDDAVAVINHYRSLGIPLKNILLNGHSLGGAILTMAASTIYKEELAALQKSKKTITDNDKNECSPRLINNRSFSTLADEIMVSILHGLGTGLLTGTIYGLLATLFVTTSTAWIIGGTLLASGLIYPQIPEFFFRPILNTVLWLSFGRMDAFSAYQALPNEAKDYIIAKDDGVICERATIHYRLKSQRKTQKKELRKEISNTSDENEKVSLYARLLNIKDCKLRFTADNSISVEAHNCPMNYLKTFHKLIDWTTPNNHQISGDIVM
ncbi:MAG: hypothetical protein AB7D28_05365, partial [Candidatus Berkiella sp.]